MKTIVNDMQKGFLYKDGNFVKMLDSGKHYSFFGSDIKIISMREPLSSDNYDYELYLKNEKIAAQTTVVEVLDEQIALHFVNGKFSDCISCGKRAFWNVYDKHEFIMVDISKPEVSKEIPKYIFSKLPLGLYTKIEVAEYQKACLYFDQKLVKILEVGCYYFWKSSIKVGVEYIDTRRTLLNIAGQEMLTQDKVSVRINFVCSYCITDYVRVLTEIDSYVEQIHVTVQLALREYVGKYKLDEILENKEQISNLVFLKLKEKECELFVEFKAAGVKDIILPGEIRDIMNTVLVAEKRAQANVITRREEVASTRSLLNTAKLMDENKTLYKLKELEYLEKICGQVGSIHVSGNGDILSQLVAAVNRG